MYAVIKTGGKQYRVAAGEKIKVEQIAADVGQEIVFDQVRTQNCKLARLPAKEHRSWHRKKAAALRETGAIRSPKCSV